ncbi:MAG: DUF1772 domain-containing protein [Leptospirales bacterium]|jgi:uncharacterized membrane protein
MEIRILIAAVAIAAAVLGGVFYGFSSFVMTALGRISGPEGMRAMQRINIDVFHFSFMALFFGLPIITIGLAVYGWIYLEQGVAHLLVAGAAVQVLGGFLITAFGNVPLNEALARADADSPEGQALWKRYLRDWTRWNHVRTFMCVATAAVLLAAVLS